MAKSLSEIFEPIALGAQVAGGLVSAGAAASKSIADKAAFEIQATASETNANLDRVAAGDAIRRGQVESVKSDLRYNQIKGTQIAAMAANGVSLDEGSPLNILTTTDLTAANDADVIAMNAKKEAWGFDIKAMNEDSNAKLLRMRAGMESPGRAAGTSLLTSAGAVASKWYATRNPGYSG